MQPHLKQLERLPVRSGRPLDALQVGDVSGAQDGMPRGKLPLQRRGGHNLDRGLVVGELAEGGGGRVLLEDLLGGDRQGALLVASEHHRLGQQVDGRRRDAGRVGVGLLDDLVELRHLRRALQQRILLRDGLLAAAVAPAHVQGEEPEQRHDRQADEHAHAAPPLPRSRHPPARQRRRWPRPPPPVAAS